MRGGHVGDHRIARRTTDAFAKPIKQPCGHHNAEDGSDGKQRLAERTERVTEHRQPLALAQKVAQRAREDLDDQGGGFGQPFDQADREGTGAQRREHEQRQQTVDHLRRYIHQHADEAERPYPGGYLPQPCGCAFCGWFRGHGLSSFTFVTVAKPCQQVGVRVEQSQQTVKPSPCSSARHYPPPTPS